MYRGFEVSSFRCVRISRVEAIGVPDFYSMRTVNFLDFFYLHLVQTICMICSQNNELCKRFSSSSILFPILSSDVLELLRRSQKI